MGSNVQTQGGEKSEVFKVVSVVSGEEFGCDSRGRWGDWEIERGLM